MGELKRDIITEDDCNAMAKLIGALKEKRLDTDGKVKQKKDKVLGFSGILEEKKE